MSEMSGNDRIDETAPGDIIAVDRGSGEQLYKVVFKDLADANYIVTLEDDDGATFQLTLAAGTPVKTFLQSKWESAQSPTDHRDE